MVGDIRRQCCGRGPRRKGRVPTFARRAVARGGHARPLDSAPRAERRKLRAGRREEFRTMGCFEVTDDLSGFNAALQDRTLVLMLLADELTADARRVLDVARTM